MSKKAEAWLPAVLGGPPALSSIVYSTRARAPDRATFDRLLDVPFEARWFTNQGVLAKRLEKRLGERFGTGDCALFSSGTTALLVALRALDLEGEVITTPFTFPATAHALAWNGLTPVFCDVDPDGYGLDPARAAELVGPRTSALLPVHVFGNPCDVEGLARVADANDLAIVYDAAHAFDVRLADRPIADFGDLSAFSFHATKLFHTAEGGAICGPRRDVFDSVRLQRNFGILGEGEVRGIGINGKMSELHAATGLALLDGTAADVAARAVVHDTYVRALDGVPGLRYQTLRPGTHWNYAYMPLEIEGDEFGLTRDELHDALRRENVFARKYFHPLCTDNPYYAGRPEASAARMPNATRLAGRILCLPIYSDLPLDTVGRIADTIRRLHECAPRVRAAL